MKGCRSIDYVKILYDCWLLPEHCVDLMHSSEQKLFHRCTFSSNKDEDETQICTLPALDTGQGPALCYKHSPHFVSAFLLIAYFSCDEYDSCSLMLLFLAFVLGYYIETVCFNRQIHLILSKI